MVLADIFRQHSTNRLMLLSVSVTNYKLLLRFGFDSAKPGRIRKTLTALFS